MSKITYQDMLDAGVHFGHKKQYCNPKMLPYIYGLHHKVSIIDLRQTREKLNDALQFVETVIKGRGRIVFVGTKRTAQDVIQESAQRCGMPYVNWRWLGGMLTNFKTIRQSVKKLVDLEAVLESAQADRLTKKEKLTLVREKNKLLSSIGGIRDMVTLPDALFIVDVGMDRIAVNEANKLGIPVIGVVDSNNSIDGIDYMIPGNDDSGSAIAYYANLIADKIMDIKSGMQEQEVQKLVKSVRSSEVAANKKRASAAKPSSTAKAENADSKESSDDSAKKVEKSSAAKSAKVEKASSKVAKEDASEAPEKAPAKKPAAKKEAKEGETAEKATKPAAKKAAAKKVDDEEKSN